LATPRADDLVGVCQPEGDEEQSWLVDVIVILIDDHDLDICPGIEPPQAIGAEGAPGPPAADRDPLSHDPIVAHESW